MSEFYKKLAADYSDYLAKTIKEAKAGPSEKYSLEDLREIARHDITVAKAFHRFEAGWFDSLEEMLMHLTVHLCIEKGKAQQQLMECVRQLPPTPVRILSGEDVVKIGARN